MTNYLKQKRYLKRQKICCLLFFLVLIGSQELLSQSITLTTISSAGTPKNTTALEWTIGEMVVNRIENDNVLTLGFHQGSLILTSIYQSDPSIRVLIYPNPASDQIAIDHQYSKPVNFRLNDLLGKTSIQQNKIENKEWVDIRSLPPGTYILQLFDRKNIIYTSKIVKIK